MLVGWWKRSGSLRVTASITILEKKPAGRPDCQQMWTVTLLQDRM